MNNIYGDGLLSSPELFQKAILFNQSPIVNGGYDGQTPGFPVRVIFQDEGSKAETKGGAIVNTKVKTVWSRKPLVLGAFLFFQGTVYRIMNDQDWTFQAGFFVYGIEKVVGDNGSKSYEPTAQLGGRDF